MGLADKTLRHDRDVKRLGRIIGWLNGLVLWGDESAQEDLAEQYKLRHFTARRGSSNFGTSLTEVSHRYIMKGCNDYLILHVVFADQITKWLIDRVLSQFDLDHITHLWEFLEELVQRRDFDSLPTV